MDNSKEFNVSPTKQRPRTVSKGKAQGELLTMTQATEPDLDAGNLNSITPRENVEEITEEMMRWESLTKEQYLKEMETKLSPDQFKIFQRKLDFDSLKHQMLGYYSDQLNIAHSADQYDDSTQCGARSTIRGGERTFT